MIDNSTSTGRSRSTGTLLFISSWLAGWRCPPHSAAVFVMKVRIGILYLYFNFRVPKTMDRARVG